MPVIGNKRSLALELVPVAPSWELRYPPEQAAWAGLAIWADGANLCQHVVPDSSEIIDYFFIPLAPLADWILRAFPAIEFEERAAVFPTTRELHESVERWGYVPPFQGMDEDEWIESREAWWANHFLRAGADGARLPNVGLVRDDEQLAITWRKPRFFGDDAPFMLSPQGDFSLSWNEGRAVLGDFVAQVAEWLRESGAGDLYPWARTEWPLDDSLPPLSKAIELLTGHDVGSLERLFSAQGLNDLLETLNLDGSANDPAASPPCQILRDLSPTLRPEIGEILLEVGKEAAIEDLDALDRWRRSRAVALDAARPGTSPQEAGQLAAMELRRALELDGQPITDTSTILEQLGISYAHVSVTSQPDRMIVGLREQGAPIARTLTSARTSTRWGRRFEACRALGHLLLDPIRAGAIGAAAGPFAQVTRGRRSGAFAAELLLPEMALAKASGHQLDGAANDDGFQSLMTQYGVGARTAAYQLWNRRWLSSPTVRDELIDRFGSLPEPS